MSPESIDALKHGAVGVIPTDTIYGIVASALDERAVERVYETKNRPEDKGVIVLIHDIKDISEVFGIELPVKQIEFLNSVWPGKVSVVIPVDNARYNYLSRGTGAIAFRVPKDKELRNALKKSGPLIAPSANPADEEPATNIPDAQSYFGDSVDFYEDGGVLNSEPSTLIRLTKTGCEVLREGAVKF